MDPGHQAYQVGPDVASLRVDAEDRAEALCERRDLGSVASTEVVVVTEKITIKLADMGRPGSVGLYGKQWASNS